jgi:hypothetical protein
MTKNEEFIVIFTTFMSLMMTTRTINRKQADEMSNIIAFALVQADKKELNIFEYLNTVKPEDLLK